MILNICSMVGELGGTSVTKVIVMRTFVLSLIVEYTSVTCQSFIIQDNTNQVQKKSTTYTTW